MMPVVYCRRARTEALCEHKWAKTRTFLRAGAAAASEARSENFYGPLPLWLPLIGAPAYLDATGLEAACSGRIIRYHEHAHPGTA